MKARIKSAAQRGGNKTKADRDSTMTSGVPPNAHLAHHFSIEFQKISFNYFFSRTIDAKTNPPTVTYTAFMPDNHSQEIVFNVYVASYYDPKSPTTYYFPYKLNKGDQVVVIGNVAHFSVRNPEFAP